VIALRSRSSPAPPGHEVAERCATDLVRTLTTVARGTEVRVNADCRIEEVRFDD